MADVVCTRSSKCKCRDCTSFDISAADLIQAGNIFPDRFADADSGSTANTAANTAASPKPAAPVADKKAGAKAARVPLRVLRQQAQAAKADTAQDDPTAESVPTKTADAEDERPIRGAKPASAPQPDAQDAVPAAAPLQRATSDERPIRSAAAAASLPDMSDERPLTGSTGAATDAMSEFPPEAAPADAAADSAADASGTPLERALNKNFKVRIGAYDQLCAALNRQALDAGQVSELASILHKIVADSHAVALDNALTLTLTFVKTAGAQHSTDLTSSVAPTVIDNGFAAARKPTQDKASEVIDAMFENCKGGGAALLTALIEGLNSRKPKVPPVCMTTMVTALRNYGIQGVPPKTMIAALPAMFESKHAPVRTSATELATELYRWCGAAVRPKLAEIRAAQLKEVEAAFAAVDAAGVPAVPAKAQASESKDAGVPAGKAAAGAAAGGRAAAAAPGGVDPYEFADAVDLVAKLPKLNLATQLASAKWNERTAVLDAILEIIGPVPKLVAGDFGDLQAELKKAVQDKHVQVTCKAMQVVGALASGLRNDTPSSMGPQFLPLLTGKFKDKQKQVVSAAMAALDELYGRCIGIDSILDEASTLMKATAKEPKERMLQWMTKFWTSPRFKPGANSGAVKALAMLAAEAVSDSAKEVRDAAIECLSALATAVGTTGNLASVFQSVAQNNARAHAAVMANIGGAAGGAGAAAGEPTAATPASAAAPKSVAAAAPSAPAAPPAPRAGVRAIPSAATKPKAATAAKKPAGAKSGAAAAAAAAGKAEEDDSAAARLPTPEEAAETVAGLGVALAALDSSKWQERKEALERLAQAAAAAPAPGLADAIVVHLHAKCKQFKESNHNVAVPALECAAKAIESSPAGTVSKAVVGLFISAAAAGIHDRKRSEGIMHLLLAAAQAVGPTYVLRRLWHETEKLSIPAVHVAVAETVQKFVTEFGPRALDLAAVVEYLKSPRGVAATDAKVRAPAIAAAGAMFFELGPSFKKALEPVEGAGQADLDAECARVGFNPAAAAAAASTRRAVAAPDAVAAPLDLDSLITRADVSTIATATVMNKMKETTAKDSWKGRAEAMHVVEDFLDHNPAVECNAAAKNLMAAIKPRLQDSNQNLRIRAVSLAEKLCRNLGPKCGSLIKIILEALLDVSSDNRKPARDAVTVALTAMVMHDDTLHQPILESIVPYIAETLLANANGRAELLAFLASVLPKAAPGAQLQCLAKALMQCLLDRSKPTRDGAQEVLVHVIRCCGQSCIQKELRDLKPAESRSLTPLVATAAAAAGDAGSAAGAAAGAAVAAEPEVSSAPSSPPRTASAPSLTSTLGAPKSRSAAPSRLTSTLSATMAPAPAAAAAAPASKLTLGAKPGSTIRASTVQAAPSKLKLVGSAAGSAATTAVAATPAAAAAPETAPPLRLCSAADRDRRLQKRRQWQFEEPKPEFFEELEDEFTPFLSPQMLECMFSKDVKKLDRAYDTLIASVHEQPDEVFNMVDLLLRWSTLRMFETHVQHTAKLLTFLENLFDMLNCANYQMSDPEAKMFLPFLVDKMGNPKERFRVNFHNIMRCVCEVYPTTKVVPYLFEGLRSKNTRTRIDAVEEMDRIVQTFGYMTLTKKGCNRIAQLLDGSDIALRNAAVHVLESIWAQMGADHEQFFAMLAPISDKARGLIEERLKFSKRVESVPAIASVYIDDIAADAEADAAHGATHEFAATSFAPLSIDPPASDVLDAAAAPLGSPGLANRMAAALEAFRSNASAVTHDFASVTQALEHAAWTESHTDAAAHIEPEHLDRITSELEDTTSQSEDFLDGLDTGSHVERYDDAADAPYVQWVHQGLHGALVMLNEFMSSDAVVMNPNRPEYVLGSEVLQSVFTVCSSRGDPEGHKAQLRRHANRVVCILAQCMHAGFGKSYGEGKAAEDDAFDGKQADLKFLKKICCCLMEMFGVDEIAQSLTPTTLCNLLSEVTQRLMDPRLSNANKRYEDITLAVNSLALRVSLKGRRECVMCALIKVLQRCMLTEGATHPPLPERVMRLVVKLMMKVHKFEEKPETQQQLDPAHPPTIPWQDVDVAMIIDELRHFFSLYPPDDANASMPIKAAIAVFRDIVHVRQESLRPQIDSYPASAPIRALYAKLMSPADGVADTGAAVATVPLTRSTSLTASTSLSGKSSRAPSRERDEVAAAVVPTTPEAQLHAIFAKLSTTDRSRGAAELLDFKQQHPDFDILAHLSGVSPQFKQFIMKCLEQSEAGTTATTATHVTDDDLQTKMRDLQRRYNISDTPAPAVASATEALTDATAASVNASIRRPTASGSTKSLQDIKAQLATIGTNSAVQSSLPTATSPGSIRRRLEQLK